MCHLLLHRHDSQFIRKNTFESVNMVYKYLLKYFLATLFLQLVLLVGSFAHSLRVYDFDSARYSPTNSSLSSATLTNTQARQLPDRFTICFSTKQSKIDGKAPFVIYGEDDTPWMAFSFWNDDNGPILWADVQGSWGAFQNLEKPWTHVWKHVCADVDTVSGNLSVSLDRRQSISVRLDRLKTNRPQCLTRKLVLGISNSSMIRTTGQFYGSIAGLHISNIIDRNQVKTLSKGNNSFGDIMAWSDMIFDVQGTGIRVQHFDVPNKPEGSYMIILPLMASWDNGNHYCRTLGRGNMSEITNGDELNTFVFLVKDTMPSCSWVWLPITDEEKEGNFKNTNTEREETFLMWDEGQPNGGKAENCVKLDVDSKMYKDGSSSQAFCISCTLKITTTFRLRGLCKDTYMGKIIDY